MLNELRYVDAKVADSMVTGFPLVGELEPSGVYPLKHPEERVAGASVEWFWASAKEARENQKHRWKGAPVDNILGELYKIPCGGEESEVQKGWANGPYTEQQMKSRLGPGFLSCRRFGVEQNGKIRPTNDFFEYFHNSCVTSHDQIVVSGVDAIASMCRVWPEAINSGSRDAH